MAIKTIQDPGSQRLTGVDTFVWKYTVVGTDIIDQVADAVLAASPPSYGFWVRNWPQKSIVPDPKGGGRWEVEVPYNVGAVPLVWFPSQGPGGGSGGGVGGGGGGGYTLPGEEEALGPEWSGDFQAGNIQMRRSREVVGGRAKNPFDGGPPIDLDPRPGGGPIGFDPSTGTVEGLSVPKGVQTKTIELKMPYITPKFEKRLESYQFMVNSEAIFNRAPGEVRFEGARTQFKHADGATVVMTFGITRNLVNVEVGPFITLDAVDGWDYIDPTYTLIPDPDDPTKFAREVTVATIHRVHPRGDLNDLFT